MGGVPESLFISLALPRGMPSEVIQKIMTGAADLAREFNCGIDGGDTNTWNGPLAINVCVTGRPHWRGAVTRNGALAGDVVMVSGLRLGGSLASGRHLTFTPRVPEATWLMDHFVIHSMMDLSDGLAADVPRLAAASDKQIILEAAKIIPASFSEEKLTHALCDGEDFELLFTCDEAAATQIEQEFPWPCGVRRIGTVTAGTGVLLRHPSRPSPEPLKVHGYEHG
jgi:thiamine-monophosphate kinase